ncbi:MAG TPA: Rpn family recombination-promoting nuclease/putative transposase [Armatimonadota bacterium]|nr:Rpn family recombination-promoting nuclease/putative transposase [Armatimonadota bacterium]
MLEEDAPPIREFMDRGIIWLLGSSTFLRDLLAIVSQALAARVDLTQAQRINRSFIPDDLRKRETDLIVLAPYVDDGNAVPIYLMLDHQSEPDPTVPFRVLRQMVYLWDQECRGFEDASLSRSRWRLHLVIPIVFYTGGADWSSPQLLQMMDTPAALARFAPVHDILFLNLAAAPPETLTGTGSPLGWLLRVM